MIFDASVPAAVEFAYKVEENLPSEWDDQARAELAACTQPSG